LSAEKFEDVKLFVAKNPDATLDEIIEELSLPIHKSRLSVLFIEAGLSFKKRCFTPKHNKEKMSKKRLWVKLVDNIFSPRLWRGKKKGFQLF
jgi:transposase